MKILKAYKFRLKPAKEQVPMLKQHGGNARFVWNKLLEYANNLKKDTNHFPTQSLLQKQIIQLKSANDFIKIGHSQPIQINAMRLNDTFVRAFKPETIASRNKKIAMANEIKDEAKKTKALARALNFGFPKFKSKNRCHDSLFYPQNFIIKRTRIHFPKLGWINYIRHREIEGVPKFVTITQDGTQYYVSVTCELEIEEKTKPSLDQANIAGIDKGLGVFAELSDGTKIKNPRTLKRYLKKIRRMNKKLARQELKSTGEKTSYGKEIKKSSNNRNKQIVKVQKVYRKIRNIRKDFIYKTVHYIITKYDGVAIEDLDIAELLRKNKKVKNGRALNRGISDVSWYEFDRILEYESLWKSKYFVKIDRYFPSTQRCSRCGNIAHLTLKDRVYVCECCGLVMGRDPNASINIRDEGMRVLRNNNTVAGTGIKACGSGPIGLGMKQEKRRFQAPMALA